MPTPANPISGALPRERKPCIVIAKQCREAHTISGRNNMLGSKSVVALAALAASLFLIDGLVIDRALAFDDNLYPNLKGQWVRARPPAGVRSTRTSPGARGSRRR
jgi:hypothetical protein